jgi:uncharacterized YigZ family protein
MSDTYRTLKEGASATLKVDGSRFLAEAVPVASRDEAEERIAAVRKREHRATHHCTAYRLGPEGDDFRYDDDGEPSGTAGQPILRRIHARDLTNTLVVVTRYFGGTELGTGGLMQAYGDAAEAGPRPGADRAACGARAGAAPLCVRRHDTGPAGAPAV